ncbi:hypothetical protein [Georgenia thermotolerans]|uniref:DUF4333 domain-containing protein n=1 Tax=Georgenia thermotolerans TaxID=527326 RepID=A0A7J5ULK7_9MICO|nr:hypothetical protein [Georgenia thermotolerans]KAE8763242.1 hypothetical protein GB883_15120 [Georgenia thermotolerans]
MRHPTATLAATALLLLAATTGCAWDAPDEPTVDQATADCLDAVAHETGYHPVVQAVTPHADHAWTIEGLAGPRAFTCQVAYTYSVEGVGSELRYEIDPPTDVPTTS